MAYDDGDNFLKGPEFTAWMRAYLAKHRPELRLPDALQRRLWEWEKDGVLAPFASVDRWLVHFDLNPYDLPDDFWVAVHRRCPDCGEDIGLQNYRRVRCKPCARAHQKVVERNRERSRRLMHDLLAQS